MLDTISYLLIFFIETLISYLYCETKFERKTNKLFLYISLSSMFLILYLSLKLTIPLINLIVFFICNFLFMFLCYKADIRSCLFNTSLLLILMAITETVVLFIFSSIFDIKILSTKDNPIMLFFQMIFSKSLYYFTTYLISKISIKEHKSEKNASLLLCSLPLASTFLIYSLVVTLNEYDINLNNIYFLIISTFLLLLSNIIVFLVYEFTLKTNRKNVELEIEHQKNKAMSEYYSLLNQKNEDTKIIIHDFKRHLNTIKSLSNENDQTAIYIDKIMKDFKVNVEVDYCNNTLLNVITNKYQTICNNSNIKFNIDIRTAQIDFIDNHDITALFDNLLENAVDASIQTTNPFIDFMIHIRNNNYLVIKVANSVNQVVDIVNNDIVSNKKISGLHGVGLKSIRRVVKKYNGEIFMEFDEKNMMFTSKITFDISQNIKL